MSVVGDNGIIEMDMFGPGLDVYRTSAESFCSSTYGSDLDHAMVNAFIVSLQTDTTPEVTLKDGIQAAKVALAGYRSVASGTPVSVEH